MAVHFTPVVLYAPTGDGGRVDVSPFGQACVRVRGCWQYDFGTEVVLHAQPDGGWAFSGWSGFCASVSGPTCRFGLMRSTQTSPGFRRVDQISQPITATATPTIVVKGPGQVVFNYRNSYTNCPGQCTPVVSWGTTLVLRARAVRGHRFKGWGGACLGTKSARCQVQAETNYRGKFPVIRANFA